MTDHSAKVSRKLGMLPPYLFARIDRLTRALSELPDVAPVRRHRI